jgi:hypothetical protein
MNKVAQNKKILAAAEKIAMAIEMEAEEILEHAEAVIKEYVPAKHVKAALTAVEKALDKEGVEALFDKTVSREALRKTASMEVTAKEVSEVVAAVANAVVAEFEDVLEDADAVATAALKKVPESLKFEVESKLKNVVEKKMASKGIYFKMSRTAKQ